MNFFSFWYSLVCSWILGNTSILVILLSGCLATLFLALHSYCPESLTIADFIISSDRCLKFQTIQNINFVRQLTTDDNFREFNLFAHLKCTNWYLDRFRAIDLSSLNQVTLGGGWPRTLHIIRIRLPSLIVALFAAIDSM